MKEYIVKDSGNVMMVGGKIVCELVRCANCKHGTDDDRGGIVCEFDAWRHSDEFFCADGEKK